MTEENIFEDLVRSWELELQGEPIKSATGVVAFAKCNGRPVVLKISKEDSDEKTASVLQHYDGNGAVRVLKASGWATLIERAMPGTPLTDLVVAGEDDKATHIVCDIIEKLHSNKKITDEHKSIADWGQGFDRYTASGDNKISKDLIDHANGIYADLVVSQGEVVLLHGDLHHYNILKDTHRGWLSIDPKGIVGESTYEVGAMLRNPIEYPNIFTSQNIIDRRVAIICECLGFDRKRVLGWAFSQAVLAAVWSIEGRQSPEVWLDVADAFRKANVS